MKDGRKGAVRKGIRLFVLGILPAVVLVLWILQQLKEGRTIKAEMGCILNLKQLDGAIQSWGLEHKKAMADTYALTDTTFLAFLKGSSLPRCPLNGIYSAGTNMGDVMKCNIPGHTLKFRVPMGYERDWSPR